MRITRIAVLAGVALAVVGLLAIGASAVTADERDPARGWRHAAVGMWRDHGGPDPARVRQMRSDFATDLAAELETSPDAVEGALRGVAEQRLDRAVADGRVAADDVDGILAAYDDGDVGAIFRIVRDGGGSWGD